MSAIIPAIDIIDGNCVRLSKGDYNRVTKYEVTPLAMAQQYEDLGIDRIHIVDLDAAKNEGKNNIAIIEKLCRETSLKIQTGGGIRTSESLERVLNAGAERAILGSVAQKDPTRVFQWLSDYGSEKIVIGADVHKGMIAVEGWQEISTTDIFQYIQSYVSNGAVTFLCTDIEKDGMLEGPNFTLYKKVMDAFPDTTLIASGGVSGLEDIARLVEAGMDEIIVGKAIYEGRIDLEEAIKLY